MRYILFFIITISFFNLFSQDYNEEYEFMWLKKQQSNVKELKKYEKTKLRLSQEFDSSGNCVFIKNNGLNGDIIAIWGRDFDQRGRVIKTVFAHSNIGFYIYEIEYIGNVIKQYTYINDTIQNINDYFYFNPYKFIRKIKSKKKLYKCKNVLEVYNEKKYLDKVTVLDEQNRPTKIFRFDHRKDTLTKTFFQYTKNCTIKIIEYEENGKKSGYIDSLFLDPNGNIIKEFKTSYIENTLKDTLKNTIKTYDSNSNLLTSSDFLLGSQYKTTINEYKNDHLINMKYFDNNTRYYLMFTYEYDLKGMLIKEKIMEVEDENIEVLNEYKTTYIYW